MPFIISFQLSPVFWLLSNFRLPDIHQTPDSKLLYGSLPSIILGNCTSYSWSLLIEYVLRFPLKNSFEIRLLPISSIGRPLPSIALRFCNDTPNGVKVCNVSLLSKVTESPGAQPRPCDQT